MRKDRVLKEFGLSISDLAPCPAIIIKIGEMRFLKFLIRIIRSYKENGFSHNLFIVVKETSKDFCAIFLNFSCIIFH